MLPIRTILITAACPFLLTNWLCAQTQQASQQPEPSPPAAAKPAPAPPAARENLTGELTNGFSVTLSYWYSIKRPVMRNGKQGSTDFPSVLDFPGKSPGIPEVAIAVPAGRGNAIRLDVFRTQASGSLTAQRQIGFFGTDFSPGDFLTTRYTLQTAKLTWDYLSWPYPPQGSLRFKTLWGVQYTSVKSTIDAPRKDATATDTRGSGTNYFILPTLGVGIEKWFNDHVRFDLNASGFAIPKHAATADAVADIAVRRGPIEIAAGGRGFYFKTTPGKSEFVRGLLPGGFVSLRYYIK